MSIFKPFDENTTMPKSKMSRTSKFFESDLYLHSLSVWFRNNSDVQSSMLFKVRMGVLWQMYPFSKILHCIDSLEKKEDLVSAIAKYRGTFSRIYVLLFEIFGMTKFSYRLKPVFSATGKEKIKCKLFLPESKITVGLRS